MLQSPWWVLLLAVAGVVALATLVISLFSAVGDRPRRITVTRACGVDSDEFLLGVAGTLNVAIGEGGGARLLNNGDRFFPAMLDAIGGARRSVNFMVYIWEPGQVSDRFFDALTCKAREGVPVRVMVDGFGGHRAPERGVQALRAAGGRWERFHPVRFGQLTRFHRRNHRRALVVDGELGFTGGGAVHDQWLGDARTPDEWRDSMVEVRGPVAANLQSAFAQLWAHVTGELLTGPAFYPGHGERLVLEARAGEPISRHVNVVSSPSTETHPLRQLFWLSFAAARRSIYITNPYFVPERSIRHVLYERVRAGVDVRVLAPGEHIDVRLVRWASHAHYEEMLEAGVRIYEFQPTMIHQKTLVVDGRWSLIGSANMDVRSKELNQENVFGLLDRGFGQELEQTFCADLERAREIRLDEFRRRPVWERAAERLGWLVEEQV